MSEEEKVQVPARKMVRALRQGTYEGHRRRQGALFSVPGDANEKWFEEVGPAPEGDVAPPQIQNCAAPAGKSFTQVMKEQAEVERLGLPRNPPRPQTLAEAAGTAAAPVSAADPDADLT